MQKGRCAVVRQSYLIAVVVSFLIAVVVVGCGGGGPGNIDERGSQQGAGATNEETTAPKGDQPKAQTAQEPVGLDAEVVSPLGQANVPAGFGEGSLWATDYDPRAAACDDVKGVGEAVCGAPVPGEEPAKTLLKRVDPRTGKVVAAIALERFSPGSTEVAFGADSVWVSSGDLPPGAAVVLRVDPRTKRVVDRISVDPSSGLAFGHGSVWVTSASYGTVSRIDPQTGEVAAKIEVGRGAGDIAVDESSGAVWVAGLHLPRTSGAYSEYNKLSRVDPETNRVVAEIPIRADSRDGGASSVAVGEGAVWVQSVDGRLLKVDPATNEFVAMVSVGEWSYPPTPHLAVYGGGVWTMVQAEEFRLVRVDPRTMHIVAYKDIRPFDIVAAAPGLAAGGGYIWFSSGDGLARVSP
jgi:hypothetical protein